MATENAIRDDNHITAGLAVLNTDTVQGTNKVRIKINPLNNGMKVSTSATISFTMVPIDARDENYVDCLRWEGTDGRMYPWVATANGEVLIDI